MTHRYRFVITRQGIPVWFCASLRGVLAYLWGRNLTRGYVVYDAEHSVPVDDPSLLRWKARYWPRPYAAGEEKA